MNPGPRPIPHELIGYTFTPAQADRAGVTSKMLRGRRFVQVHHGVCARADRDRPDDSFPEETALHNARDYLPLLRAHEAFSHTTALLLQGAPILTDPMLHVTATLPSSAAIGRNIIGHRTRQSFEAVLAQRDVPCVPPEIALTQSERLLSFRELVVAIDHLILPRKRGGSIGPLVSRERLGEYLWSSHGKGANRLRAAFEISRIGAESRYETLTRFELARMGLDELELQVNVYGADGQWIGRFDLVDKAKRKIVEYDGEQHRTDRAQYLRDEKKLQAARDAGFDVLRLHKEDLGRYALASTRWKLCKFLDTQPRLLSPQMARYFAEPL